MSRPPWGRSAATTTRPAGSSGGALSRSGVTGTRSWTVLFGDKDRRKDQLTTKSFPGRPSGQQVEGYGALGGRTDTAANGDTLPVFELRTPSKAMTYAQAHQWALDMFDYIVSLNANPAGGHTRI